MALSNNHAVDCMQRASACTGKCVLQAQFPGQLNINVDKLEGKSLKEQAALYSNASIVIQTHGAALGKSYIRFIARCLADHMLCQVHNVVL